MRLNRWRSAHRASRRGSRSKEASEDYSDIATRLNCDIVLHLHWAVVSGNLAAAEAMLADDIEWGLMPKPIAVYGICCRFGAASRDRARTHREFHDARETLDWVRAVRGTSTSMKGRVGNGENKKPEQVPG